MPWLALKLLGLWGWIKRAAGWAVSHPKDAAIIILALFGAWSYRGWTKEAEGRAADRAAYVKAQKEAKAKQDAADLLNLKTQAEYNRQLEANHAKLEAARGDAVREFIAARRVRGETACRPASGAGAADLHPDPAPLDPGPAPGDYVAVRPEEIDAISKVELQNAERGEFIRGLIEQGLAVPEVGF